MLRLMKDAALPAGGSGKSDDCQTGCEKKKDIYM